MAVTTFDDTSCPFSKTGSCKTRCFHILFEMQNVHSPRQDDRYELLKTCTPARHSGTLTDRLKGQERVLIIVDINSCQNILK